MYLRSFSSLGFIFCICFLVSCQSHYTTKRAKSTLTVSTEHDPQSLDPRQVQDIATTTTIHMLYEGLMRLQNGGKIAPALAESVTISPDQKIYTFKLRSSGWSNGQRVTAYDFESTWKSLLDPQFMTPNAYQLYVLKNAQAAKEGKIPLEHVGVEALDDSTLVVELEKPTSHFLRLTATHFFYPVHSIFRYPLSPLHVTDPSTLITNGPFKVEKWTHNHELTAIPQDYYWDRKNIHLDRIALRVLYNSTALQLFHQGTIQWTGSPLSTLPVNALTHLKKQGKLEITPAAGVYFLRLNTSSAPFDQLKMRQAFAYTLHRSPLVKKVLQGNQQIALGFVPPYLSNSSPYFQDSNKEQAQRLFQEALKEKKMTLANFPKVSLCYAVNERSQQVAQMAQQQWKETLGIHVELEACQNQALMNRLNEKNYQISLGGWFANIYDPISFLDLFKYKNNGINHTEWENKEYISLLNQSLESTLPAQRLELTRLAEQLLMHHMPIIPLFYASYPYVKASTIKNVHFSELGYLDFKHAYFEDHYLQTTID